MLYTCTFITYDKYLVLSMKLGPMSVGIMLDCQSGYYSVINTLSLAVHFQRETQVKGCTGYKRKQYSH
jgi:hypothetical protein